MGCLRMSGSLVMATTSATTPEISLNFRQFQIFIRAIHLSHEDQRTIVSLCKQFFLGLWGRDHNIKPGNKLPNDLLNQTSRDLRK